MGEKKISLHDASLLLDQLMKGSIPVLAVFTSDSGTITKLYGFVDSITDDLGIVISSTQGMPSMSSVLSMPMGRPLGTDCRFSVENAPDESMELKYGDTALLVRRQNEKLALLFTSKSVPK